MEKTSVSILCYTVDNSLLDNVGLVEEGGYLSTIESGINPEDSSLLLRAKNIFSEKFQLETKNENWKYLGEVKRKKDSPTIYCYAIDISEMKVSGIKMIGINKILKISDAVCQSSFFRLFSSLYKKDILQ